MYQVHPIGLDCLCQVVHTIRSECVHQIHPIRLEYVLSSSNHIFWCPSNQIGTYTQVYPIRSDQNIFVNSIQSGRSTCLKSTPNHTGIFSSRPTELIKFYESDFTLWSFLSSVSGYTLTRLVHRLLRHRIVFFSRGYFTFRQAFFRDESFSLDADIKVIWHIRNKPVQESNSEKDQVLKYDDEGQSNSKDVVKLTVVIVWILWLEVFLVSADEDEVHWVWYWIFYKKIQ